MENIKMVVTLFIFCFIAAFLLAYVDKKTHPIISKLKAEQEAKAKKEVLLLKNGGLNLSSFPEGKYEVKSGKNIATFNIKNNEVAFTKLIIDGIDYLKLDKQLAAKEKGKGMPGPISILLKGYNENRVISPFVIEGTKKTMKIARNFLKKYPKFVGSLINLMLSPVHYKKTSVIYLNVSEKVKPVTLSSDGKDVFTLNGKEITYSREGNTVKILKVGKEKAVGGKSYRFSNSELKLSPTAEYKVRDFYDAYYGEKYIGTVFKIAPICFADKVVTVVGVRPDGKVSGIKVLSQAETPGLGARVLEVKKGEKEPWWQAEFHDLKVSDLYLKHKDIKSGKIDAFTAATITPRKLTAGIRKAVESYLAFRKTLKEEVRQ
jgi:RnfABCDGE-type electron transport complex G subunit